MLHLHGCLFLLNDIKTHKPITALYRNFYKNF